MQITIDTAKELSDIDLQILRLLTGDSVRIECVPSKQMDLTLEGYTHSHGSCVAGAEHIQTTGLDVSSHSAVLEAVYNAMKFDEQPSIEQVIPQLAANQPGVPPFAGFSITPIYDPENPPPEDTSTVDAVQVEATRDIVRRLPDAPSLAVDADTDTAGVKWDATLHSESRAKCADGTWRKRRTAKNVVVTPPVTIPAGVNAVPVVPMPEAPEPDYTVVDIPSPPTAVEVPAAPTVAVPEAPFVPVTSFRSLMEVITQHMAKGNVTSKDINAICHEHGIDSIQQCFDNTALIPSVHTAIHKVAAKAGV